jgi:hypothetical protein
VQELKARSVRMRNWGVLCTLLQTLICFSFPIFAFFSVLMMWILFLSTSERTSKRIIICLSPVILSVFSLLCFCLWSAFVWIKGSSGPCFRSRMLKTMTIPNIGVPSISACIASTGRPGRPTSGVLVLLFILSMTVSFSVVTPLTFLGYLQLPYYTMTILPVILATLAFISLSWTSCTMFNNNTTSPIVPVVKFIAAPLISTTLLFLRLDGLLQLSNFKILAPVLAQTCTLYIWSLATNRSCSAPAITLIYGPWLLLEVLLSTADSTDPSIFYIPLLFGVGSQAFIATIGIYSAFQKYSRIKSQLSGDPPGKKISRHVTNLT